jgi:hypothetical protein
MRRTSRGAQFRLLEKNQVAQRKLVCILEAVLGSQVAAVARRPLLAVLSQVTRAGRAQQPAFQRCRRAVYLMSQADIAMYRARHAGKGGFFFIDEIGMVGPDPHPAADAKKLKGPETI